MYLDYSLRKFGILIGVIILLASLVYATHAAKMDLFGSTPYFYSISTGTKYVLESFAALFGRPPENDAGSPAPGILILTYHRVLEQEDVNNITVERFREQMETLKSAGWETVSLDEFERFVRGEIPLPEKSFLLTFDDGAKQSFYPVDPILQSLGYEASIFIIVESSKTAESTYYMTPEEIRAMLKTNRWQIGSHSYDGHHPYGTDTPGEEGIFFADRIWNEGANRLETEEEFAVRVRDDLSRAQDELARTYGVPINTLAFPLGNETGIQGANNYPAGAAVTESIARSIYEFGFVQTDAQRYTLNFPASTTTSFSPRFAESLTRLRTDFLARRIHVDYDWDGARLLAMMENGLAKRLPYEDDFTADQGWISAWGALEMGRNNFQLVAEPAMTSASAFLDGSALWDDYSFDASVRFERGFALVLADVLDSKTYHACAFAPGEVRLQRTIDGTTATLKTHKDPRIQYGNAQIGIRVHGSVIECTWDFESVVEDYSRTFSGGIGLQTWNPEVGTASLTASSLIVRPYAD